MVATRAADVTHPIRVLLVEDHREMAKTLRDVLKLEPDFRVIGTARNGLQAVVVAPRLRPDIILMSYSMPHIDGIEATRRIKRALPDVVVIMVSVTDSPVVIEAAFRAGVRDFFVKPIAPFGELYDALRRAHRMRNVPVVARRRPKVHRPPPAISPSTRTEDM